MQQLGPWEAQKSARKQNLCPYCPAQLKSLKLLRIWTLSVWRFRASHGGAPLSNDRAGGHPNCTSRKRGVGRRESSPVMLVPEPSKSSLLRGRGTYCKEESGGRYTPISFSFLPSFHLLLRDPGFESAQSPPAQRLSWFGPSTWFPGRREQRGRRTRGLQEPHGHSAPGALGDMLHAL